MKTDLQTKTEEFQRSELDALLVQCTADQQALFRKIYPNGIPADKLEAAYALCERTVKRNHAKPNGGKQHGN